jgi:hypothetical protein
MPIQIRRTRAPDNPPVDLLPGQLAVEMAHMPNPRLWVGVPAEIDPTLRREIVGGGAGGGGFQTGDIKLTFKQATEPGWIIADDGSIGNAASGATTRADADTADLFALFWDIPALGLQDNAGAAVSRGADAAEDFAASRRLVIPRTMGRALAGAGAGVGLLARQLGEHVGADTHTQTAAQVGIHVHPGVPQQWQLVENYFQTTASWGINGTVNTQNNVGGGSMPIVQPTIFLNVMIKL